MIDAKKLSEAIRMKRKKLKEEGVENMVDTTAAPQMDPNSIMLEKQQAHMDDVLDLPEKSEAPSDPADPELDETQEQASLKKRMARVESILSKLSVG